MQSQNNPNSSSSVPSALAAQSSPRQASDLQVEQTTPQITENKAVITLADHVISGVKEGSLSDLQFRPNASFHPIREVLLKTDRCELIFDRPIRRIDRPVEASELLLLIQNIKRGERDLALGQDLYLYPGSEAFALSPHGELRIVLRNLRPSIRYHDSGQERVSLIAFLTLIKEHSPSLWQEISPHQHKLENLNQLEALLQSSTILQRLGRFIWRLCLYALFLWLISIPIAAFGPPQIREPLKRFYHPVFERLTELMSPTHQDQSGIPQKNNQIKELPTTQTQTETKTLPSKEHP